MKGRTKKGLSPLVPSLSALAKRLVEDGYPKTTADQYLSICRKFDHYVARRRLDVGLLGPEHVEGFIDTSPSSPERRRSPRFFWRRPLALLLAQLRADGLLPAAVEVEPVSGPGVAEYLAFLREHRGLCESTVARHACYVGSLLEEIGARTEEDLRRLEIEKVDQFLVSASRVRRRLSMGAICSSVRGFLGHLHMRGILTKDLRAQVATPRMYSLEAMPRSVAWQEIEKTFATIDRTTLQGVRDRAMLSLVAHGGLRASEVAGLQLTDVDWRADRIHVRRLKKGTGPVDDVPIVPPVGEALVEYLRRRPQSSHAHVFLTIKAPLRPLEGRVVSQTAAMYLRRAAVKAPRIGSHTLRHSFAVELLRRGQSLRAIGDVLGHRHPQSTFLYLKAAVDDLRDVALDLQAVLS